MRYLWSEWFYQLDETTGWSWWEAILDWEVNIFSELPSTSDNVWKTYLVLNSEGTEENRKEAWIYYSNWTTWNYADMKSTADNVYFDKTGSNLLTSNVWSALKELDSNLWTVNTNLTNTIDEINTDISNLTNDLDTNYYTKTESNDMISNLWLTLYALWETEVFNTLTYQQTAVSINDPLFNKTTATVIASSAITWNDIAWRTYITKSWQITGYVNEGELKTNLMVRKKSSWSANFTFYFKYYHTTSAWVETLLAVSNVSSIISSNTFWQASVSAIIPKTYFNSWDRLIRKTFYSKNWTWTDPIAEVTLEWPTPSYINLWWNSSTLSQSHNSLLDMQWGNANNYYHLTLTERTAVQNMWITYLDKAWYFTYNSYAWNSIDYTLWLRNWVLVTYPKNKATQLPIYKWGSYDTYSSAWAATFKINNTYLNFNTWTDEDNLFTWKTNSVYATNYVFNFDIISNSSTILTLRTRLRFAYKDGSFSSYYNSNNVNLTNSNVSYTTCSFVTNIAAAIDLSLVSYFEFTIDAPSGVYSSWFTIKTNSHYWTLSLPLWWFISKTIDFNSPQYLGKLSYDTFAPQWWFKSISLKNDYDFPAIITKVRFKIVWESWFFAKNLRYDPSTQDLWGRVSSNCVVWLALNDLMAGSIEFNWYWPFINGIENFLVASTDIENIGNITTWQSLTPYDLMNNSVWDEEWLVATSLNPFVLDIDAISMWKPCRPIPNWTSGWVLYLLNDYFWRKYKFTVEFYWYYIA